MSTPKISLITVSYNSGQTIEDTIRSVAAQTYLNVEYLVIDGLSTDTTLSILDRYSKVITKVVSEKDNGIYDAMNKGIVLATGDIIGLINSDDVLADERVLERIAQTFSDNPDIDACYGDLCYVKSDDVDKVVRYWRSSPHKEGRIKKGWMPPHPTLYVRRAIYEACGCFDLGYKIAADFELMLRFFEINRIRTRHIPQVLVKMRLGGTTNRNFRNIALQNLEIRRALSAHGIASSLTGFVSYKLFTRLLQFIRRPE